MFLVVIGDYCWLFVVLCVFVFVLFLFLLVVGGFWRLLMVIGGS